MTARPTENRVIDKYVLLRIFKQFKAEPNKVFVLKDFFTAPLRKYRGKYLNTLISLDLIEQVQAVYTCGVKMKCKRNAMGYKLKKVGEVK